MSIASNHLLDFVTARLHGSYRRRAAPEGLDDLARLGSFRDLVRAAEAPAEADSCAAFEMWLARDLTRELYRWAQALEGPPAAFVEWLALATKVEDLKTRTRCGSAAPTQGWLLPHLFHAPASPDTQIGLPHRGASPGSGADRALALVLRPSRRGLPHREEDRCSPVRRELALDRAYLIELLARARRLDRDSREMVLPLVRQEIDLFHLRCALGVSPGATEAEGDSWRAELHVPGSAIGRGEFVRLVRAGVGPGLAGQGLRRVLGFSGDDIHPPASGTECLPGVELERRAWQRLRQLACRAFRRDPTGLAALAGYVILRWIAAADLGRLVEGLRLGLTPAERRARWIHAPTREAGHA